MTSLSSAPALILLQVSSRLVTFILNQTLVRLTSPAIFGAANIQLELLLSTILFLSREGVRGALLRIKSEGGDESHLTVGGSQLSGRIRAIHNISLLPVPIGALISLAATYLYTSNASPTLRSQPDFKLSVSLYALGALLELCSEPLYTRAQTQMKVNLRVRAEGLAVLAKCLVTVAGVALPALIHSESHDQEAGLISFGLGQAAYGLVTLLVYLLAYVRTEGLEGVKSLLTLTRPSGNSGPFALSYFDPLTLNLAWVMVKQSILKHLLTEGDRFAVAKLTTLSDQGGYALASNYGSLVARMLFQPIEESSRLVFSRELGSTKSEPKQQGDSEIDPAALQTFANSLQAASRLLSALFKLYVILSLFFLTFGPPLSFSLLYVVAGSKWALTSAPQILGAYCCYLPIMGLNGVAEAFLQATADQKQLSRYSKLLICASFAFCLSLWGLGSINTSGGQRGREVDLVWSSCISLTLRAAWSWGYIMAFFYHDHQAKAKAEKKQLASISPLGCLPSKTVLAIFFLSSLLLRESERRSVLGRVDSVKDLMPHIGVSLLCLAGCLLSCLVFERRSIINSLSTLRGSASVQPMPGKSKSE